MDAQVASSVLDEHELAQSGAKLAELALMDLSYAADLRKAARKSQKAVDRIMRFWDVSSVEACKEYYRRLLVAQLSEAQTPAAKLAKDLAQWTPLSHSPYADETQAMGDDGSAPSIMERMFQFDEMIIRQSRIAATGKVTLSPAAAAQTRFPRTAEFSASPVLTPEEAAATEVRCLLTAILARKCHFEKRKRSTLQLTKQRLSSILGLKGTLN